MAISHGVRWADRSPEPGGADGSPSIQARQVSDGRRLEGSAKIVYATWGERSNDRPPVFLLHGSPGGRRDFAGLADRRGAQRSRTVRDVPEALPGGPRRLRLWRHDVEGLQRRWQRRRKRRLVSRLKRMGKFAASGGEVEVLAAMDCALGTRAESTATTR